jgi:HemY protein
MAGRLLGAGGAGGDGRKARRLLQTAWRTAPHPDLLAAWLDINPGAEPEDRLEAVQKLVAETEDSAESRMAVAAAALEAGEYDLARVRLKALMEQAPSAKVARLIADLEEAERGDGAQARQWLRQAASLPADATWVCGDCGRQNSEWAAHCPDCGNFDSFTWRAPSASGAVLPYAAGQLAQVEPDEEPVDVEILPPDVEPAPARN